MDPPVTFGQWLRHSRNELGLPREEFARRVGCSVSALRKIEDGERRPSSQIAELIANCLNLPLADRPTFVKVARGELSVDRLPPPSKRIMPASASPAPTPPRTNLPVLPTPLIGREREVQELVQLLRDPRCRLLTLVGPGGIGKTRLAIEAASQVQDVFADGVYFIPLAAINTTRFVVPVIADGIGFGFQGAGPTDPKQQLFSYLREKQVLLLMDNFEQLLTELGAEALAELLADASHVKLLATSREPLDLQEEWVFGVQGLPIPESQYAEGTAENTSVELFVQRARRAHVGFNATPGDYPAIVRICRLVGGMPLAIELAAAWVRTLTCDEIAQEIERGLDFLSAPTRDLPARHRSMRAVFDQSWRLLMEEERGVLLRLSVFEGGFRRKAAEAVAVATLPVLSTLVTKSLIRRSGGGRYDLHELVHQFAAEHLTEHSEEQTATLARHGEHYLMYFSQADGGLRSSAQLEALAELTLEMDNFRKAWDWAIANRRFALIEQTLRVFWLLYDTRGWFQDGQDMLGRAIEALETRHKQLPIVRTEQVALAHLLSVRSWLAYRLGQYGQAQAMLERSLDLLTPLQESRVLVESIHFLGQVMEVTGNYARALELYSNGLDMAQAIGDRWYRAAFLTNLYGLIANADMMVKPANTHQQLQSVVDDWRAIGDPRFIAFGLRILSQSAFAIGRYDEARAALEESVALNSLIGDRWGLGSSYRGLGLIAQAKGEQDQAVDMFQKGVDTFTKLGGSWWLARVLAEMGRSILALGDAVEAERVWRESLRIAAEISGTPVALEVLADVASLDAERGDKERALALLSMVLNHPASFQETKNRAARLRAELEAQLTSQKVEAAQAWAQAKTLEAVVDEVLKHADLS